MVRPTFSFALLIALATVLSLSSARAAAPLPEVSVELHSHLFMKPGLGWLFRGSFDEPLSATDWGDRLSCKANATALDSSGIGIAVVALFAHPLYVADMRQSIREQIKAAQQFCAKSPQWQLARSAEQARQIVRSGKRALVLSLEGASGVLESEEDLVEFIDEAGIAIVTPLHLVDDRYGGVATINGFQRLANPLGMVDSLLDPHCDGSVMTNPRGLTPLGFRLIAELVARGVWIDLTHSSDRAIADMLPLLERARQPLLFTHTSPRAHRLAERALSAAMLAKVARSGGMIGLLPSEDAFEQMSVARRFCPSDCDLSACQGSVHALAQVYHELSLAVGNEAIAMGSDYNGGMRHLARACNSGTSLDGEQGLWNMGQQAELWTALKRVGAPVPPLRRTLARFLSSWSRVNKISAKRLVTSHNPDLSRAPALPSRRAASGPGAEFALNLGAAYLGNSPALSIGADLLVLKDMAQRQPGEPALYFIKLAALTSSVPFSSDLEYLDGYAAPVGARASWYDSGLWGDVLGARFFRNSALDQAFVAQWLALRGEVRTMPGIFKRPGHYDLFLGLGAGVLGYKYVDRLSTSEAIHAFVPLEGSAELGASFWPTSRMRFTLRGKARADWALARVEPLRYQSDVMLGADLSMTLPENILEPYLDVRWLMTRYGERSAPWISSRQIQTGARLPF